MKIQKNSQIFWEFLEGVDLFWVKCNNDIPSSLSTSNTRRCFCYSVSVCSTFYDSNKFIDLTLSDDIIWAEICILDIYPSFWYTVVYIVVKCIWTRKISKFLRYSHRRGISFSNRQKFQELCTSNRTSWRNSSSIIHHTCSNKCFDSWLIRTIRQISRYNHESWRSCGWSRSRCTCRTWWWNIRTSSSATSSSATTATRNWSTVITISRASYITVSRTALSYKRCRTKSTENARCNTEASNCYNRSKSENSWRRKSNSIEIHI